MFITRVVAVMVLLLLMVVTVVVLLVLWFCQLTVIMFRAVT